MKYRPYQYENVEHNGITYTVREWNIDLEKGADKMQKTFREVIRDIKVGEEWETDLKLIKYDGKRITISEKTGVSGSDMILSDTSIYTKVRQAYDLQYVLDNPRKYYEIKHELITGNKMLEGALVGSNAFAFILSCLTKCFISSEISKILKEAKFYTED